MEALFETFNSFFEGRNGNWDADLRNFLEFYLQELHNETSCSSMINFSQAAIVLQKSTSVYEKKVDYLSQLVVQLLDVLQLSKSGTETIPNEAVLEPSAPVDDAEPSTTKKNQGRKSQSNYPYLFEEFSRIHNNVSDKSLDLVTLESTASNPELTLIKSAVFGKAVIIKKKRKHELCIFDKNEECIGKKYDFRLSWSLNNCCALVDDPFDDPDVSPPPVSECLSVPMTCDPLETIPSPGSPGSTVECADDCMAQDPDPTADVYDPNPPSPNQEVSNAEDPGQVSNESPSQEVPVAPSLEQEVSESPNQEVPEAQTPNVAGSSASGASQDVMLPDTPPDSQQEVLRSGPGVDVEISRLSIIEESDEVAAVRKSLRDKVSKDRDILYPLNFFFSSSLFETLDDSKDESSVNVSEKLRAQAKNVMRKGKRRFREVFDEEEGLAGFEEIVKEPQDPDQVVAESTILDLPQEEVLHLNVPVPTPPPTPSNSQPMSPDVSRSPRSDIPETRCPSVDSPMGDLSPGDLSPVAYTEERPNIFNPYGSDDADRSAKVAEWRASIKQRLEETNSRPPFDVHVYGSKVITSFPSVGSSLDFKDLVAGVERWEIPRIFLTSLMLANTGNVDVSLTDNSHLAVDCMSLRLLSTQRHEEELEAFCAPSVDLQRRSNKESRVQGTSSDLVYRKRKLHQYAHSRPKPHKKNRV